MRDSDGGLYRVSTPDDPEGLGPAISQVHLNRPPRASVPTRERADLVVPRVYLEPDERMDRLRARALRWAIARDMVIIAIGLTLLWRWVAEPLIRAVGF